LAEPTFDGTFSKAPYIIFIIHAPFKSSVLFPISYPSLWVVRAFLRVLWRQYNAGCARSDDAVHHTRV